MCFFSFFPFRTQIMYSSRVGEEHSKWKHSQTAHHFIEELANLFNLVYIASQMSIQLK